MNRKRLMTHLNLIKKWGSSYRQYQVTHYTIQQSKTLASSQTKRVPYTYCPVRHRETNKGLLIRQVQLPWLMSQSQQSNYPRHNRESSTRLNCSARQTRQQDNIRRGIPFHCMWRNRLENANMSIQSNENTLILIFQIFSHFFQ